MISVRHTRLLRLHVHNLIHTYICNICPKRATRHIGHMCGMANIYIILYQRGTVRRQMHKKWPTSGTSYIIIWVQVHVHNNKIQCNIIDQYGLNNKAPTISLYLDPCGFIWFIIPSEQPGAQDHCDAAAEYSRVHCNKPFEHYVVYFGFIRSTSSIHRVRRTFIRNYINNRIIVSAYVCVFVVKCVYFLPEVQQKNWTDRIYIYIGVFQPSSNSICHSNFSHIFDDCDAMTFALYKNTHSSNWFGWWWMNGICLSAGLWKEQFSQCENS